jgi:DNA-binding transcriptional regulator YdaS (Cro superfamily)
MNLSSLDRAISICGSQASLAASCDLSQASISNMRRGLQKVSAECAIAIERATRGQVTRHDLRPDLYPREHNQKT